MKLGNLSGEGSVADDNIVIGGACLIIYTNSFVVSASLKSASTVGSSINRIY